MWFWTFLHSHSPWHMVFWKETCSLQDLLSLALLFIHSHKPYTWFPNWLCEVLLILPLTHLRPAHLPHLTVHHCNHSTTVSPGCWASYLVDLSYKLSGPSSLHSAKSSPSNLCNIYTEQVSLLLKTLWWLLLLKITALNMACEVLGAFVPVCLPESPCPHSVLPSKPGLLSVLCKSSAFPHKTYSGSSFLLFSLQTQYVSLLYSRALFLGTL